MNTTRNERRVLSLSAPLEVVTFDIYRDIHKGIRAELFGVTIAAGNVDPNDDVAVRALGQRFRALVALLDGHAAHEDRYLAPLLQKQSASLAGMITEDHGVLEVQLHRIGAVLENLPASKPARRLATHRFYLALAWFTSSYLEHQAVEELEAMPALATGVSLKQLLTVNAEIMREIPPEAMTATLALLLPAMNVEDRTEMLAGIRAAARPQAFAGVLGLARSVLAPEDYAALAERVA